jgi:hypothetical protein
MTADFFFGAELTAFFLTGIRTDYPLPAKPAREDFQGSRKPDLP